MEILYIIHRLRAAWTIRLVDEYQLSLKIACEASCLDISQMGSASDNDKLSSMRKYISRGLIEIAFLGRKNKEYHFYENI